MVTIAANRVNTGDIIATFNGQVVGQFQSLSLSTTRESAPYIIGGATTAPIGQPIPIDSYAELSEVYGGARGYSGTLSNVSFDEDMLAKMYEGLGLPKMFYPEPKAEPKTNADATEMYLRKMEEL